MSKKFLYLFKEGHDAFGGDQTTMKNTLGGKGAGLAEMTHAGMPVPQGFTITTEACTQYYADNREINDEIKADIFKYMGILEEQTDKDELYASELKGILLRLRPDFNEKAYGCATFLKVLDKLSKQFGSLRIRSDNFNVMVSAAVPISKEAAPQLSKENWRAVIQEQLHRYKEDGFDRINPSILKADLQATYPDFSERALGFKRFSDMLKALEKDGLLTVELDEQGTMLINVL